MEQHSGKYLGLGSVLGIVVRPEQMASRVSDSQHVVEAASADRVYRVSIQSIMRKPRDGWVQCAYTLVEARCRMCCAVSRFVVAELTRFVPLPCTFTSASQQLLKSVDEPSLQTKLSVLKRGGRAGSEATYYSQQRGRGNGKSSHRPEPDDGAPQFVPHLLRHNDPDTYIVPLATVPCPCRQEYCQSPTSTKPRASTASATH